MTYKALTWPPLAMPLLFSHTKLTALLQPILLFPTTTKASVLAPRARPTCTQLQASSRAFPLGYPQARVCPSATVAFLSCEALSTCLCPHSILSSGGLQTRLSSILQYLGHRRHSQYMFVE